MDSGKSVAGKQSKPSHFDAAPFLVAAASVFITPEPGMSQKSMCRITSGPISGRFFEGSTGRASMLRHRRSRRSLVSSIWTGNMTDLAFLAYLPDPFSVRAGAFWCMTSGCQGRRVSAEEVSCFDGTLVTYGLPALIDELRRAGHAPQRNPIDIGEALRLVAGVPRDEGGEKRWDVWRHLAPHFSDNATARLFIAAAKSRVAWPDEPLFSNMLNAASHALEQLWDQTKTSLRERGELDRFLSVEVPVQRIFAHRQAAGIAIDRDAADALLVQLERERYGAFQRVATTLCTNPTGLNFWNIGPRIGKTDLAHLACIEDGGRLRDAFKLASNRSNFAKDFLQFANTAQDEITLRRAAGIDRRLYPTFSIIGTVTGRILVSDPQLQQLRRHYRGIVSADPGKRLTYLDYSQFEPGILAFLSGDAHLISAYCRGDLYKALSQQMFGTDAQRPLSKRIFLAFCYGMTSEGIARLVSGVDNREEMLRCQKVVDAFFMSFPGLDEYRARMEAELGCAGYVSSIMGNRRYRTSNGPLTPKEKRWALNQPVQATASLIFKEALISLAKAFGRNSILLPVHDAVLLQLDDDGTFDEKLAEAEALMLSAFESRCPGLSAKVSVGPFGD